MATANERAVQGLADERYVVPDELRPLVEKHDLTVAEALFVSRQVEENGLNEDDVVKYVKAERVGVFRDDSPDQNVPGGHIAPPNVNASPTLQEQLATLVTTRNRLNQRISALEDEITKAANQGLPTPTVDQDAPTADAFSEEERAELIDEEGRL